MINITVTIKLIRNILISLFSTIWILPFYMSFMNLLIFLEVREPDILNLDPEMISFSYVQLSRHLFIVSTIILFIAVFFWAFVAANRLWPIKGKDKKAISKL